LSWFDVDCVEQEKLLLLLLKKISLIERTFELNAFSKELSVPQAHFFGF
jgi:hypothetical protein